MTIFETQVIDLLTLGNTYTLITSVACLLIFFVYLVARWCRK